MDLGLSGRTAFVTGGSAGIGLGIAHGLLAEGASVSVCGRDQERLDAAVAGLREAAGDPVRAHGVRADVTDPDALGAAVDEAAAALGGLDLLVANAGGTIGNDLLDTGPDDWAATFSVNVLHAAHAIRVATPHLTSSGHGSVLIVSSVTGWKPGPRSSYGAAKAAEIHLAATLAQELAGHRIRVNALSPGSVLFEGGSWDARRRSDPDGLAAWAHDNFPAGRLVTLPEVVDTALFVLSDRGSGVNGANVCVDGGQDRPSIRRFLPAAPPPAAP